MDPPGINNTERDNLRYEEADRNGSISKFQSHTDPPVQSHKIQSCVSTDDKNVSTDLQNFQQNNTDNTTTVQPPPITTPTPTVDTSSHNQRLVTNENLFLQTDTTSSRDNNFRDKVITTTTDTTPSPDNNFSDKVKTITTPTLNPRLLVNTVLTKQTFTNIINEYSSNEPTNAVTTFILRNLLRPRIQYRTNHSRPFVPITGNNLTQIDVNNSSLAYSYNKELYSHFMKMDTAYKQKTHQLKFGINQISNKSQSGQSFILPPVKTIIDSTSTGRHGSQRLRN